MNFWKYCNQLLIIVDAADNCKPSSCGTLNGHDYVDFGLPSGTLWATCNIGAKSIYESGDKFAWGETIAKNSFKWDTYKHSCIENVGWIFAKYVLKLTKYTITKNGNSPYDGVYYECDNIDNTTRLDLSDDAAHVNWGGSWRMPTIDDFKELAEHCRFSELGLGIAVTNNIDDNNFILLPDSIYWSSDLLDYKGEKYICSSDRSYGYRNSSEAMAFFFKVKKNEYKVGGESRRYGYNIRPVSSPLK